MEGNRGWGPQGSVLDPLHFLVYINDLPKDVLSTMKLFADDSSPFIRVNDVKYAQHVLETDLETISEWGHKWKISVKKNKPGRPLLSFNNIPVARETYTKHLGLFLDEKLSKHIKEKIAEAMKGIALLKFLSKFVSKDILNLTWTMEMSFVIIKEWI